MNRARLLLQARRRESVPIPQILFGGGQWPRLTREQLPHRLVDLFRGLEEGKILGAYQVSRARLIGIGR